MNKTCPACCVDKAPSPSPSMAYLLALNESKHDGLDKVIEDLCPQHRGAFDAGLRLMQVEEPASPPALAPPPAATGAKCEACDGAGRYRDEHGFILYCKCPQSTWNVTQAAKDYQPPASPPAPERATSNEPSPATGGGK